jgi:hypothetical protein
MKIFSSVLCAALLFGAFVGSADVAAGLRGKDIVPLAPVFRIVGVAENPVGDSSIRLEAKGAPGSSFTVILTARDMNGAFLLDPLGNPIIIELPGLVIGANGCWDQSFNVLALSLGMPDFVIEGAAIPLGNVQGHILSWRTALRAVTYSPGAEPPLLSSSIVEVPGVVGQYQTTTLAVPDPLVPGLFHLAENGPGGVYPIG